MWSLCCRYSEALSCRRRRETRRRSAGEDGRLLQQLLLHLLWFPPPGLHHFLLLLQPYFLQTHTTTDTAGVNRDVRHGSTQSQLLQSGELRLRLSLDLSPLLGVRGDDGESFVAETEKHILVYFLCYKTFSWCFVPPAQDDTVSEREAASCSSGTNCSREEASNLYPPT